MTKAECVHIFPTDALECRCPCCPSQQLPLSHKPRKATAHLLAYEASPSLPVMQENVFFMRLQRSYTHTHDARLTFCILHSARRASL